MAPGDLFDRAAFSLVDSFRAPPGAYYNGREFTAELSRQIIKKVVAGEATSAAITDVGKLYTWGAGNRGQLGLGCAPFAEKSLVDAWDSTTNFDGPQPRPFQSGANQVPAVGRNSRRFVDTDTRINCPPFKRITVPTLVEGLAHTYVDKVVISKDFAVAITHQCGAQNFADSSCLPIRQSDFKAQPILNRVSGRALGSGVEMMLHQAGVETCICGEVYMWGGNDFGQLGQGNYISSFVPTLVSELSSLGIHISDVALGAYHVVALSTQGNVYTWGYNANGQLGTWNTLNQGVPVRVRKREPGFLFVSSIAASAYHSVMVSDRGDIYSFGSNRNGQLGNGQADLEPHPYPEAMQDFQRGRGMRVVCGAYHCLAVSMSLTFYKWGWNAFGQLAQASDEDITLPVELQLPPSIEGFPVLVSCGYAHTIVVLQTGDLTYCGIDRWGRNTCSKQLRFGDSITSDEGGVWWVVRATKGQIIVTGNEALEFDSIGTIQLYRNETDLGIYPYSSVRNMEGYVFSFESVDLAFDTGGLVPDALWKTSLLA